MNLFVIGTGRCGTTSMHSLLNAQNIISLEQERKSIVWNCEDPNIDMLKTNNNYISGEVSPFILPFIEKFITKYNDTKVILMLRNKLDTYNSYKKWVNADHNYWCPKSKCHWTYDYFDDYMPTFELPEGSSFYDYFSAFYEFYLFEFKKLQKKFSKNKLNIFQTEHIKDIKSQINLLKWIGIAPRDMIIDTTIHLNKSKK